MTAAQQRIMELKKEKDAVILAHYYQNLDIQDIADHVGDSFALAQLAQTAKQSSIIMCGVRFMAESAKILSPDKDVYLPVDDAGCPMADMITPRDVLDLKEKHPGAKVMCYVNSSAAVKAVSDICCTSSSALRIAGNLGSDSIIFVPDQNLGAYVQKQTPGKRVILFPGYCPVHNRITADDAKRARKERPNAKMLAHPECRPEVLEYADYIGSTSGILDYARTSSETQFIIGTETGVLEILQREMPEKSFWPLSPEFICGDMKKTRVEDVLSCLEGGKAPIEMDEAEMLAARAALDRMVSA